MDIVQPDWLVLCSWYRITSRSSVLWRCCLECRCGRKSGTVLLSADGSNDNEKCDRGAGTFEEKNHNLSAGRGRADVLVLPAVPMGPVGSPLDET